MSKSALVVDDSMLIRHTVCRFFEERGIDVHSASNGAEALSMLRDLRPDLIITDLAMPKMTGAELIEAIRESELLSRTPIVVLSARRTANDPHLKAHRGDYVIHKDIDIEEQLNRVLSTVFAPAS